MGLGVHLGHNVVGVDEELAHRKCEGAVRVSLEGHEVGLRDVAHDSIRALVGNGHRLE